MRIIGSSILALSLAAASCGDGDGSSGGGDTIGGIEYTSLGEDKYKFAGTADNGGDSSHSYEVAFDLEAGTPVTLNLFTRDDLTDGVKLDFSRNAEDVVSLTYTLNGYTTTRELTALDEEHVHLEIDVHNNETDAHVLIWNAHDEDHDHEGEDHDHEGDDEEDATLALGEDDGDNGDHEGHDHDDDDACMDEGTCLFNSAAIEALEGSGKASGSFWGAEQQTLRYLSYCQVNEAKSDH